MKNVRSFNPLDPLQSAIVVLLLRTSTMSVNDLMDKLKADFGLEYTRQHLYKVLGKMVESGMLNKVKGKFAIEMRWATHVHSLFSDALYKMPEKDDIVDIELKEGQSREYIADSFQSLISIWDKLSVHLIETNGNKVHQYFSHPYYNLYTQSAGPEFYKYLVERGHQAWTLIGNDTFLDHHAVELYSELKSRKAAINTTLPFDKDGYSIEVSGDYISELKIPPNVEMHFKFLFEHVDSKEKFDQHLFAEIFKIKAPFRLVITRNKKDAEKLRKAIESGF